MIAVIYVLLLSSSWATDIGDCHRLVTSRQTQDHTDGFISLLQDLLERQILNTTQLNRFAESLALNEIANPILESETWTSSSALIHFHAIQKYLNRGQLEHARILDWTTKTLTELGQTRELKKEAREKTSIPIYQMEFNPVEGKEFEMGVGRDYANGPPGAKSRVTVNLTHSYEMMSTHVTQAMWAQVMGSNPSEDKIGEGSTTMEINGNLVSMLPNHPVNLISWLSAVEYANRLSILKGLKPAYDLSEIIYVKGTSAEAGNLQASSGRVKINAPDGDIYQTEGYRLPTEAEYAFVLQLGGPPDKYYPFGNDYRDLEKYEWYGKNSKLQAHAVAELRPYTFNGYNFYDLLGNRLVWMHDFAQEKLEGGTNPQGPKKGKQHVMRGGEYHSDYAHVSSYDRSHNMDLDVFVSFRLARTTKVGYRPPVESGFLKELLKRFSRKP